MDGTEVDAMDSEPEEDDLMEDDMTMDDGNAKIFPTLAPKLKSTIMGGTSQLSDGGPENTKRRSSRKETDIERNSRFAT
jgi:RNA-binding protein 8A